MLLLTVVLLVGVALAADHPTLYAPKGGSIELGVGAKQKGQYKFEWRFGNLKIVTAEMSSTNQLEIKFPDNGFQNRSEFNPTKHNLTIHNASYEDSGTYSLHQEENDGTEHTDNFKVIVQDPIPRPEVKGTTMQINGKTFTNISCHLPAGSYGNVSWHWNYTDPIIVGYENQSMLVGPLGVMYSCTASNQVSKNSSAISMDTAEPSERAECAYTGYIAGIIILGVLCILFIYLYANTPEVRQRITDQLEKLLGTSCDVSIEDGIPERTRRNKKRIILKEPSHRWIWITVICIICCVITATITIAIIGRKYCDVRKGMSKKTVTHHNAAPDRLRPPSAV
ncbi:ORF11 [Fowl aviadenovirus A]|nr:ORF11 [Fowl aviadenovirus A]